MALWKTLGAVIGSNVGADLQRGRIKVSGSITAFFENANISTLFDNATLTNLVIVACDDDTADADF